VVTPCDWDLLEDELSGGCPLAAAPSMAHVRRAKLVRASGDGFVLRVDDRETWRMAADELSVYWIPSEAPEGRRPSNPPPKSH
jgi:hypothetical protein